MATITGLPANDNPMEFEAPDEQLVRRRRAPHVVAPPRPVAHQRTLLAGKGFACDCGAPFDELLDLEFHQHGFRHPGLRARA